MKNWTSLLKFGMELNYILRIVPDHGSQYEENPSSHHGGMFDDRLTDGLDPFLYSPIPLRWSGE